LIVFQVTVENVGDTCFEAQCRSQSLWSTRGVVGGTV